VDSKWPSTHKKHLKHYQQNLVVSDIHTGKVHVAKITCQRVWARLM